MDNQTQDSSSNVVPLPTTPGGGSGGGGSLGERVAKIEGLMQNVATKEDFGRLDGLMQNMATKEDFGRLDAEMRTFKWLIPLLTTVGIALIALLTRFFSS